MVGWKVLNNSGDEGFLNFHANIDSYFRHKFHYKLIHSYYSVAERNTRFTILFEK